MIEPDQYDMEPGTFHNWKELFCQLSDGDVWDRVLRRRGFHVAPRIRRAVLVRQILSGCQLLSRHRLGRRLDALRGA